jgi:hypothetical protein
MPLLQMRGSEVRFQHIAEYHIRSDCARIQALAYTEYRQNMRLFIAVDVTVDVKNDMTC